MATAMVNKGGISIRISSLLDGPCARSCPPGVKKLAEQPFGIFPSNCSDIGVNVSRRLCAEIDVIGVLVHVERKNWRTPGERMTVVRCPLVDQFAITRQPRQQNPTGTAAKRLTHRHEFGSPALIRTKVADKRVAQGRSRLALISKPVKEQDRKSTRLNSSHLGISYAVFC